MTSRIFLAAGVAALAIAAPASAKPGGGHGGGDHGGGNGAGAPAQAHGNGGGHGGGQAFKMDRGGGAQMMRAPKQQREMRRNVAQRAERQHAPKMMREQRMEARAAKPQKFERQQRMAEFRGRQNNKALEHAQRQQQRFDNRGQMARVREQQMRRSEVAQNDNFDHGNRFVNGRGLMDGCPPGLAKKNNGCLPPGQAKKLLGQPLSTVAQMAALSALPQSVRSLYPETNDYYYRYGDGYVYRVNRQNDLVSSLIPLLGGGLMPGQTYPANYYNNGYVPSYFDAFYPSTPNLDYRYAYGNTYAVNPYTGLVEDVIPNYGYGYGVGQALPAGYGYYNVPYDYRNLYANTADSNYWYAPGAIYQVDPKTQLITSVASLLAPGLNIGQQLPAGYGAYNVPLGYRDQYYDTADAWYRYNNGNIYQVDPTTQLVTAVVASLLT